MTRLVAWYSRGSACFDFGSEGFGENGREMEKVEWYKANMLLTRQNIGIDMLELFSESRQLGTE